MMEAASTSETSTNFYQTTRRNNPEDSHLQEITCLLWNSNEFFLRLQKATFWHCPEPDESSPVHTLKPCFFKILSVSVVSSTSTGSPKWFLPFTFSD
jgi:hypothetical protein